MDMNNVGNIWDNASTQFKKIFHKSQLLSDIFMYVNMCICMLQRKETKNRH